MTNYNPPWIYRNGHINTIAAASALRKAYAQRISHALCKQSEAVILDLHDGVRLQGYINTPDHPQLDQPPFVMFIHGWLGCADSLYLLPLASALYQRGYSVFRLNLRDHGGTQHLNRDLYHSCRLAEVLDATENIQQRVPHVDFYLIGFSLGGNFALRIGAEAKNRNLTIKKIFSICPIMNPENALNETKSTLKIYFNYYLRRWKHMLYKKHTFFPDKYDLALINQQQSLSGMTEHLLLRYTEFDSLKNYLNGYSITGDRLKSLSIPCEVFIAQDDPVIPASDREKLYPSKNLNIRLTRFGGHCGYLNSVFNTSWVDEQILNQLTA